MQHHLHKDRFGGHHCHIQSVERLVRINHITEISMTTALVLSQCLPPYVLRFSEVIKWQSLAKMKVM